ncbi:MAG TPA: hypothetical protein PLF01_05050 [Alphaproteobacteria bacterium]|nr:hypothetical protein [Alphaproteobacteria bacterium]
MRKSDIFPPLKSQEEIDAEGRGILGDAFHAFAKPVIACVGAHPVISKAKRVLGL